MKAGVCRLVGRGRNTGRLRVLDRPTGLKQGLETLPTRLGQLRVTVGPCGHPGPVRLPVASPQAAQSRADWLPDGQRRSSGGLWKGYWPAGSWGSAHRTKASGGSVGALVGTVATRSCLAPCTAWRCRHSAGGPEPAAKAKKRLHALKPSRWPQSWYRRTGRSPQPDAFGHIPVDMCLPDGMLEGDEPP